MHTAPTLSQVCRTLALAYPEEVLEPGQRRPGHSDPRNRYGEENCGYGKSAQYRPPLRAPVLSCCGIVPGKLTAGGCHLLSHRRTARLTARCSCLDKESLWRHGMLAPRQPCIASTSPDPAERKASHTDHAFLCPDLPSREAVQTRFPELRFTGLASASASSAAFKTSLGSACLCLQWSGRSGSGSTILPLMHCR